jgi:release factor glutamine methyltransferase
VPESATIAHALAHARALGVDRLDAQLLLAHQLGCSRAWLLAHDDAALTGTARDALHALLARRVAGEPLAYLVGEREFHGLSLRVTRDVLVPRPETETLVDWALELLARIEAPRVADLGTGSGAIALAIKHACPRAQVHASDASAAALAVARDNGQRLGLAVAWHRGDWWQALGKTERFDLALANPPYVAAGDPHLAALRYEPREALVASGGPAADGLADLRRIVSGASGHLNAGAWLLLEHGFEQAGAVRVRLQRAGFESVTTRLDLSGQPRVSGGRLGDPLA